MKKTTRNIKEFIVWLFMNNVKGRKPDSSRSNQNHDGKDGHWLEVQMNIPHNASNAPDIGGYEMKNNTSNKTTFGDWSADYYIFKDAASNIDRSMFLEIFGSPNSKKNGRYSWSGKPCPKIDVYNPFGQILKVDEDNNILAMYSFVKDSRSNKDQIIPDDMKVEELVLARWDADSIKSKVERKFNKSGWFKCLKNSEGFYESLVFGKPITFSTWIDGVKRGVIFFDSGMYEGNSRNYSQWRANNAYWDSLVVEKY